MTGRNDLCWCGSNKKWKKCHYPQEDAKANHSLDRLKKEYLRDFDIIIKDSHQIEKIRAACLLSTSILETLCSHAKAGISTLELNDLSNQLHKKAGAIAAAQDYGHPPYPAGICISLNEVICHGIPSATTILKEGDILNIDVSSILDGFFGDCSKMVIIGQTTPEKQNVVDAAYECLMASAKILKPGVLVSAIGTEIEKVAHEHGCSVVHQFVGHGVGVHFHEGPQVPHCRNRIDIPLVPGMTFTIEPMINVGKAEAIIDKKDQWTARTVDGKASAQFEHTFLITESGHEILTPWKRTF